MTQPRRYARFLLLALGMVALLAAMWAGLLRMGWSLPPLRPTLAGSHGPLMVSGFLGTLISLERAVALGRVWGYGAPLFAGLGGLILIAGLPVQIGALLITLGGLVLVGIFSVFFRRHPSLDLFAMALGALLWAMGSGIWLAGVPFPLVVPWWAGFLILTIAGERLELSRVLKPSPAARILFLVVTGLYLLGTVWALTDYETGIRIAGAGMIALAFWLLRHDIARRTIKLGGLTRFIAASLLSGYVWLGISGLLALRYGGMTAGVYYDAILHTVFLGFVFGMIFGHAPVIFPAVIGVAVPFHPAFYAHLGLLHLSLLLRVVGDLAGSLVLRQWGGLLNVFALLLFLGNTVRAVRSGLGKPAA